MEVFEIFMIRYINYINIWSVELNNDNFYDEFRDGILLSCLLRKWSNLYGYNTEGDLIIHKRPLNRSQALNNISLCLNFISNPPEKSNLPEFNDIDKEKCLINIEDVYEKNESRIIDFLNKVFHHYFIPYLRLNSRNLLLNMNKYLERHGLSFSKETINEFYKMIPKNSKHSNELLNRIESWEKYLSYTLNFENDCDKLSIKYVNALQCDITSNGFILIMIMLYHMGWIDTSILCQLYYNPKKLEEYKWNHEILYYSFQTIINYLNIQKELLLINNKSKIKLKTDDDCDDNIDNLQDGNNEDDYYTDDHNTSMTSSITSSDIPFILIPISSLYFEKFSPYILLLQIEVIFNLLTQQIDSNCDYCFGENNKLPVYGPYQPIDLDLLDELTYRDNYPINWTSTNNSMFKDSEKKYIHEVNKNTYNNDIYGNFKQDEIFNSDEEVCERKQSEEIDDEVANDMFDSEEYENELEDDRNYRLNILSSNEKINNKSDENYNSNSKELNSELICNLNNGNDEMNELFTGLEKELELLKINDNNNNNNLFDLNDNIKHMSKIKVFKDQIANNSYNIRNSFPQFNSNDKPKPLISRTALEEQKRIMEEQSASIDSEDYYKSKVLDITRKPNVVIDKITSAIDENNRLLERLKNSLSNNNCNNNSGDTKSNKFTTPENNKENKVNITNINTQDCDNSNNDMTTNIYKKTNRLSAMENNKKSDFDNRKTKGSAKSSSKNKVSFSDRVKMEVEKSLIENGKTN